MKYSCVFNIILLFAAVGTAAQSHFIQQGDFTSAMNINAIEAKANGVNLESGDEIGIFDDTICVGVIVLEDDLGNLTDQKFVNGASGADDTETSVKDGFTVGNSISFRYWDASENVEIPNAVPSFYNNQLEQISPKPTFEIGTTTFVSLAAEFNYTPKSNAGEDIEMDENDTGKLDGSTSTDLNGDTLTYSWQDLDNLGLTVNSGVNPSFVAPSVTQDTKYRVVLVVSDGEKESAADTVIVTVLNVIDIEVPPVADAGEDIQLNEGEQDILDGSNSHDTSGLALEYSWIIIPDHFTPDSLHAQSTVFIAPDVTHDAEYLAVLTVTNTAQLSDKDTVVLTVINVNQKPIADAGQDIVLNENTTGHLDARASSDPDGTALNYHWEVPEGFTVNDMNSSYTVFTAPEVQKDTVFEVVLQVEDGEATNNTATDTMQITVYQVNQPPVADAGADIVITEGETGMLNGQQSYDPDGDSIQFSWNTSEHFLQDSLNATPVFTAPLIETEIEIPVILTVNDGTVNSDPDTVWITVQKISNQPPVANAGEDLTVNERERFVLNGSASSDPEGDSLSYYWLNANLPAEGTDSVSIQVIAPEVEQDSIVHYLLMVNDGELDSDPDTVTVFVKQVNQAPVFTSINDSVAEMGYAFSTEITVTDPDKLDVITLSAPDLPEWLYLTDNGNGTATLSSDAIPRDNNLVGEHKITIQASDGIAITDTNFILIIQVKTGIEVCEVKNVKIYPNPFTDKITVELILLQDADIEVQLLNQLGQTVNCLFGKEKLNPGIHHFNWDGTGMNNSKLSNGIYHLRVIINNQPINKKLIENKIN